MNKDRILDEIKRTAAENGGVPLGQKVFEKETGIGRHVWRGKFWRMWSDAVAEAGFIPNEPTPILEHDVLVAHLATLTRSLGRFPTDADTMMAKVDGVQFPHVDSFRKLGTKAVRIALVRKLVTTHPEFQDILAFLPDTEADEQPDPRSPLGRDGAVYMLKLGKHYKVGKTFSVPRRHQEIAIELPEKPDVVHVITTDDPTGIEAYWHRRFDTRRTNGEWFALSRDDVAAFKRRKFM
ncbi:MAG: GIY-YIG nuclease family protein [Polyangiales bacterium]